jgi:hypothetical protein
MKIFREPNSRKLVLRFLCVSVSLWLILLTACSKNNSPQTGGGSSILSFDETKEAGDIVRESNEILKQIKKRFKDNEPKLQQLQEALKGKDTEKVRTLTEELITEINLGTEAGQEAINKLRVAQDKNINEDYKEYLLLKTQALEKYVEAFDERRKAAILLREGYDPKNAAQRQQVIAAFKEREEKFKEIMEDARKSSEQANQLAQESLNRKS